MDEEELEMGMFQDLDFDSSELNLDDAPEEIKKLLSEDDSEENEVDDSTDDDKDVDEDANKDPEGVVDEEGNEEGDNQDDSPNIYSSFADVLKERGLLPSLDLEKNKVEDIDALTNAIKSESENIAKEYIVSKIGEDGYQALEKGITLEEYQAYKNTTDTLDKVTDEVLENDLELSKNIILQDYISQGISQERAFKLLKKTIDLGEEAILEDAKESLVSLKQVQAQNLEKLQLEREKELQAQAAQQEKIDNDLKSAIYSSTEIIKGIKVDKGIQDKVYNSITKVVGKAPNGVMENQLMRTRRENPVDFDTKLYYLYELTDGFKDFSKLINKTESKVVNKLEETLRRTNFKDLGGTPAFMSDPNSYGGSQFGSELVL